MYTKHNCSNIIMSFKVDRASTIPALLQESKKLSQAEPTLPLYTVFPRSVRICLAYFLGFTSLASSLTATIYLPLIPLLSADFSVSIQAINLTITLYIVFQAISPAFFATLSDSFGRRPSSLCSLGIYTIASLGLALNQRNYAVLLILRAIQSIGGSTGLALAYGVVADVAVPAERGKMLGPMLAAANLGPCIGPLIGGWVVLGSGDFRWCFWSLVIFGASSSLSLGFLLPETGRKVVGNGSIPAQGIWKVWWPGIKLYTRFVHTSLRDEGTLSGKGSFKASNPLKCLRIVFHADAAPTLWLAASAYAIWYCIQASIPLIYTEVYGYDSLQVGLCFLTGGTGVIIGGLIGGKLLDWNYRIVAKKHGFSIDRSRGDDLTHFPIELARSRFSIYLLILSTVALVGYGWAVRNKVHASLPLILQALLGCLCTIFLQAYNALLVDVFPDSPSTASAAGNITRCSLSAIAIAALNPLVSRIGYGWVFSALAIMNAIVGTVAIQLLRHRGMAWRQRRLQRHRE